MEHRTISERQIGLSYEHYALNGVEICECNEYRSQLFFLGHFTGSSTVCITARDSKELLATTLLY